MNNLVDQQTEYLNDVSNLDKERPSPTTLQTYYELLRHKNEPKAAYRTAYSGFRALMWLLNNR